jgi:hypothetical protein
MLGVKQKEYNIVGVIVFLSLTAIFLLTKYTFSQDINTGQQIVSSESSKFDTNEYSGLNTDTSKGVVINDTSSIKKNSLINFTPNTYTSMKISRYNNANIKVDGELNEDIWKTDKAFGNFSEVSPGDNTKPEVGTEVRMFYDDNNLYFGFTCYENDISSIRKTLCERDKMFNDDFCGFYLDTYNEGRQAYEIFVNPYGIQGDLIWTTPGNEDSSFDMIWYSATKIYKDRWTIEIVIPFKSIRFPDKNIQNWQIQFLRIRPRENRFQYSLISVSRDNPTLFTKAIKINGVQNIKGGKNIEVLPYAISTQSGSISDNTNADSKFKNEKIKGDFGFNLKYGITSNITADLTYNPDFSQVESDAGVITANNTYAFSYNEKRPFFLEGGNIFSSVLYVVYTRAINNPLYALKLTGKIGKTEFGYLNAYDKQTPFIVPFAENSDFLLTDRKSLSNIFRIKHTLKDESFLGFIYTDREVNDTGNQFLKVDGYNRTFGIDGKLNFLDNYILDFQFMKYITKEINYPGYDNPNTFDNGKYTSALDGEYYSGYQNYAILTRSARSWNYNISYRDISPTSRRDNGYLSNNDFREISTWQGYLFYPDSKIFLRVQPQFYGYIRSYYDGRPREQYLRPEIWMQLCNQIDVDVGFAAINNEHFGGVFNEGVRRGFINMNVNTLNIITLGGYFELGKYVVRTDNPSVGYGMTISLSSKFKPFNNIVMQNNYDYFELEKSYRGEKLYAGYILRNTTSYNLTKDITFRMITQFDSFSGNLYLNPLGSYKPNPFTIFYFGFTHQFENLDSQLGPPRYVLIDRQFFLKMQYLFRI